MPWRPWFESIRSLRRKLKNLTSNWCHFGCNSSSWNTEVKQHWISSLITSTYSRHPKLKKSINNSSNVWLGQAVYWWRWERECVWECVQVREWERENLDWREIDSFIWMKNLGGWRSQWPASGYSHLENSAATFYPLVTSEIDLVSSC